MTTRFDIDTAVIRRGEGTFTARIDPGWWIERGPNGGYIAAILMQALVAHDSDEHRNPRSLTVHYHAPGREGPAEVTVRTERAGRTVHYLTARLSQGERLLASAQAAFALLNAGAPSFIDRAFPDYPHPDTMAEQVDTPAFVPMRERYHYRVAEGALWDGPSSQAETGGWIRLREPRPYDPALVVALADAWHPAAFARMDERMGVPTIDLTVHLRSISAMRRLQPEEWLAVRFRTTVATEGFLEEDGELWTRDGALVAHSRQLALILQP